MDHNPSIVALSSLYVTGKVDEVVIPADELVLRYDEVINGLGPDDTDTISVDSTSQRVLANVILNTELKFLELLEFHLIGYRYHPYHSLGIAEKRIKAVEILGQQKLGELISYAKHTVSNRALLSDLQLLHPPAVIFRPATVVSAEERSARTADREMIMTACGVYDNVQVRVLKAVKVIRNWQQLVEGVDINAIKELEKRRQQNSDHLNNPLSADYEQKELDMLAEEDAIEIERSCAFQERLRQSAETVSFSEPPQKQ